jgi:hypothetical protein
MPVTPNRGSPPGANHAASPNSPLDHSAGPGNLAASPNALSPASGYTTPVNVTHERPPMPDRPSGHRRQRPANFASAMGLQPRRLILQPEPEQENAVPNLDDGSDHTSEKIVLNFVQWHQNSTAATPETKAHWEKIAEEPNAKFFSGFLAELSQTEEYTKPASRPTLEKKVSELMDELLKSPSFRETCFTVAMDASATCHDRIALSLNNMGMAKINHDAEHGKYDNNQLADLGRAMFRLEVLNNIADRTIAEQEKKFADNPISENIVDPLEVRLGFQTLLADIVKAPGMTTGMLYLASANITPAEIEAAAAEISRLDSPTNHVVFLKQWGPWQKAMQRANKEKFTALNAKIDEDREWLLESKSAMNSSDYGSECSKQAAHVESEMERFMARTTWTFLSEQS